MKIAVCIKQVPDTRNVLMDETTGTVVREGVELIINPLDLYAVELALQLKEKYNAETTAFTMGPPQAISALREAVAMGIDAGNLICGREFAGSDTWGTAWTLAAAIRSAGEFDLVICGERATDGDTGQVGPGIAAALGWPVVAYVNQFSGFSGHSCNVSRIMEHGVETVGMALPGVITVVKEIGEPRLPTLNGKLKAKQMEFTHWNAEKLKLDVDTLGLKGSPTRVVKIFHPQMTRQCRIVRARNERELSEATAQAIDYLREVLK